MSIAQSFLFQRRQWSTPQALTPGDLGLPAGYWSCSGQDEGDGSGGDMTFQHIFSNPINGLGDGNLYSIEQLTISSTVSNTSSMLLQINGMDSGTGRVATPDDPVDREYLIDMDISSQATNVRAISRPNGYKIWVGRYQGLPTDLGDMILRVSNPTGSDTIAAVIQGYYWTPGAVNAPGGIRKPIGDVFAV